MADKTPKSSPRPAKEGGIRKGGGGWQKPVTPPGKGTNPPGPTPKK